MPIVVFFLSIRRGQHVRGHRSPEPSKDGRRRSGASGRGKGSLDTLRRESPARTNRPVTSRPPSRARRWNGIMAARMKRVAPQDSSQGHPAPTKEAVFLERRAGVLGTRGREPASSGRSEYEVLQRRQGDLINPNQTTRRCHGQGAKSEMGFRLRGHRPNSGTVASPVPVGRRKGRIAAPP